MSYYVFWSIFFGVWVTYSIVTAVLFAVDGKKAKAAGRTRSKTKTLLFVSGMSVLLFIILGGIYLEHVWMIGFIFMFIYIAAGPVVFAVDRIIALSKKKPSHFWCNAALTASLSWVVVLAFILAVVLIDILVLGGDWP